MWILLTKKLPTNPSPPKLSIFWSVPWSNDKIAKTLKRLDEIYESEEWLNARKIRYKDTDIRVFPHEFNAINTKFLQKMIDGEVYTLTLENTAEQLLIEDRLGGNQKEIFESALLEGCTKAQGMAVALGQDVIIPDWEFPPIGWYKPNIQYANFFCTPREMKE